MRALGAPAAQGWGSRMAQLGTAWHSLAQLGTAHGWDLGLVLYRVRSWGVEGSISIICPSIHSWDVGQPAGGLVGHHPHIFCTCPCPNPMPSAFLRSLAPAHGHLLAYRLASVHGRCTGSSSPPSVRCPLAPGGPGPAALSDPSGPHPTMSRASGFAPGPPPPGEHWEGGMQPRRHGRPVSSQMLGRSQARGIYQFQRGSIWPHGPYVV